MTYPTSFFNTFSYLAIFLSNKEVDNQEFVLLLKENREKLFTKGVFDFKEGIIGYGWLIAFIGERDALGVDIDEFLHEIDDEVYKYTLSVLHGSKINLNVCFDLINFYQQRLLSTSPENLSRNFVFYEMLGHLIAKTNDYLQHEENVYSNINFSLTVLLKYSYLSRRILGDALFEEHFYPTIELILTRLEHSTSFFNDLNVDVQTIILRLLIIARQYNNKYWIDKLEILLEKDSVHPISSAEYNVLYNLNASMPSNKLVLNDYPFLRNSRVGNKFLFDIITNIYPLTII